MDMAMDLTTERTNEREWKGREEEVDVRQGDW